MDGILIILVRVISSGNTIEQFIIFIQFIQTVHNFYLLIALTGIAITFRQTFIETLQNTITGSSYFYSLFHKFDPFLLP